MPLDRLQISMPKVNDLEPAVLLLLLLQHLLHSMLVFVIITGSSTMMLAVCVGLCVPATLLLLANVLFFKALLTISMSTVLIAIPALCVVAGIGAFTP